MGLREEIAKDFPDRATFNAAVTDGVEAELNPVKADVQALQTEQQIQKTTLTTLGAQVAGIASAVAAITATLGVLKSAVDKAQAAADRAQATADSKPGGEGSGGYAVILAWTSSLNLPDQYISVSSLGKSISQRVPANTEIKLAGLTSGSVVTFGVDIGDANTVQWKNKTTGTNLSGRSSFYRTFSGFTVPATTGTGSFVADIG